MIPIGLDFHVISPPSNQTQYLDIGVQFGASEEDAGDVGCRGRCDEGEIAPTARAASQAPGPMLWSGSSRPVVPPRARSHVPDRL